jgi:DNA-binding beta-propeller fold protein YncE
MPDRPIDDVLAMLPARVDPDAGFDARLRERLRHELLGAAPTVARAEPTALATDDDELFQLEEVREMEATVRQPGFRLRWRAVAAAAAVVAAAVLAATVAMDDDDPPPTATVGPPRTFLGAAPQVIPIAQASYPYFVAAGTDGWVASLAGDLQRIDASTGEVLAETRIPESSAIAVDEHAVWVADAVAGDVLRLSLEDGDLVERITTGIEVLPTTYRIPMLEGASRQFSVIGGITTDGTAVWVGDRAGRVLRIDPDSSEIVDTFDVSVTPDLLRLDGHHLLVANLLKGDVAVIDTESGDEVLSVSTGDDLAGAALFDGAAYLQAEADGVVTRIDLETGDELTSEPIGAAYQPIGGRPTLPTGLTVSGAGVLVDVDSDGDSLHVLDLETLDDLGTIPVTKDQGDMTIAPDGSAWLVRSQSRTVVRIEPRDL